jgi:hypothetical protein
MIGCPSLSLDPHSCDKAGMTFQRPDALQQRRSPTDSIIARICAATRAVGWRVKSEPPYRVMSTSCCTSRTQRQSGSAAAPTRLCSGCAALPRPEASRPANAFDVIRFDCFRRCRFDLHNVFAITDEGAGYGNSRASVYRRSTKLSVPVPIMHLPAHRPIRS